MHYYTLAGIDLLSNYIVIGKRDAILCWLPFGPCEDVPPARPSIRVMVP